MEGDGKSIQLVGAIFLVLSLPFWNKVSASSDLRRPCNTPCLLISTPQRILAADYNNQSSFTVISNLSSPNHGYYVDVHYNLGYLFWSDRAEHKIKRSNMDGTNITVIHNDTHCVGLAVDWVSMRLYWTDNHKQTISVSDFEGNNINIVHSTKELPKGIAVDPHRGLMFWAAMQKIERSNLHGTQRDVIVSSNLSSAHSITLDRQRKLLFWLDYTNNTIESVDYSGNNRVLLSRIRDVTNLFGIAFTSSLLFVGEWHGNAVFKVNASNGTVLSRVQFASSGSRGIFGYDSTLQPDAQSPNEVLYTETVVACPVLSVPINVAFLGCNTNTTEMLHGTECRLSCKEGSVGSGSTVRRCTANGTWTGTDLECTVSRRPCNSPRLLVSTRRSIIGVNLDNNSSLTVISNLTSPWGLDLHYNLDYIFWSDLSERNIKRSNMDGSNIAVIHNYVYSYGLAVEWNSLRLYWAEFDDHSISVSDLEGNNRKTVLSTFQPFEIVLDPHQGNFI